MIKLICFVKRHPSLTPEAFHHHWRNVHARLILDTPSVARHLLGYQQNPRSLEDYERGEPPFDGVAIAWYRDAAAMEALFSEPEYLEKIRPDELTLSDLERNQWILCDDAHTVIDPGVQ